jgi:hypothetical protein
VSTTTLIDNGKTLDEHWNAKLGFWLPPVTPYGNLTLKLIKLSARIDMLNKQVLEAAQLWKAFLSDPMTAGRAFDFHGFAIEHAVYHMRRAADDMIGMIWLLDAWQQRGDYPKSIEVDCIGALLHDGGFARGSVFAPHLDGLRVLNDVSNAYKHSFLNTDHNTVGQNEPCVLALHLKDNKLASDLKFYSVSLPDMVGRYNAMYQDAFGWLRKFSEAHRNRDLRPTNA